MTLLSTPLTEDADTLWDLFAGSIAGRAKKAVRVSYNDGRTYHWAHNLGARPAKPAAVAIYDTDRTTRCLVADFDSKPHGAVRATADARTLCSMVRAAGGVAVEDTSISGGRHVYVPLAQAKTDTAMRDVIQRLKTRLPSLDPTPMLNAKSGCIRPPGSEHPRGGHQRLVTPVDDAVAAFRDRNTDEVWRAFLGVLEAMTSAARTTRPGRGAADIHDDRQPGRRTPLPAYYEAIATTGRYDRKRYRSGSEARWAVLMSAYRRGWTLMEVSGAMQSGPWKGLRRLFSKYDRAASSSSLKALADDWTAVAHRVADEHAERQRAANCNTSTQDHAAPTSHRLRREAQWLREWWSAMRLAEVERCGDRAGQSTRLVLRALVAAASWRQSRFVKVGVRSLALASTLDHTTVCRVLRRLRDEEDPLIVLVEGDRGNGLADIYELRIPDAYLERATAKRWRRGRLGGVHHVFTELGTPAALVYDLLGEARHPIRSVQAVAAGALLERAAARRALDRLEAFGLATCEVDGWTRGEADPDAVATLVGADVVYREKVERYDHERADWAAERAEFDRMRADAQARAAAALGVVLDLRDRHEAHLPPPDVDQADWAALKLLAKQLGTVELVPG